MNNNIKIWLFIIVLVAGVWIFQNTQTIKELRLNNQQLEDELADAQYSLEQANSNIEDANSSIEEAQWSAWGTYEEMGEALDNLTTVGEVY